MPPQPLRGTHAVRAFLTAPEGRPELTRWKGWWAAVIKGALDHAGRTERQTKGEQDELHVENVALSVCLAGRGTQSGTVATR